MIGHAIVNYISRPFAALSRAKKSIRNPVLRTRLLKNKTGGLEQPPSVFGEGFLMQHLEEFAQFKIRSL